MGCGGGCGELLGAVWPATVIACKAGEGAARGEEARPLTTAVGVAPGCGDWDVGRDTGRLVVRTCWGVSWSVACTGVALGVGVPRVPPSPGVCVLFVVGFGVDFFGSALTGVDGAAETTDVAVERVACWGGKGCDCGCDWGWG